MSKSLPIPCVFKYHKKEICQQPVDNRLTVCGNKQGNVYAKARVSIVSGYEIEGGNAYKTSKGIEFVYRTIDHGVLALQRYCCDLEFTIPDMNYNAKAHYTLRHVHRTVPPVHEMPDIIA